MSAGQEWYVRAFRGGDEPGIYALWEAVYGDRISGFDSWLRWWRWMYLKNPCGQGCMQLAVYKDRIVGQYAAIPVKVKVEEEVVTAGLGIDLMTHPDYRLQGILESVCAAVHREAGERGLSFVYGFPNQNSRPGIIRKLRYIDFASPKVMIRPINWENTLGARIHSRTIRKLGGLGGALFSRVYYKLKPPLTTRGMTVARTRFFDERVDRLWERLSSRFPCCLAKDHVYLNWRYTGLDDRSWILIAEASGEMTGYMVMREAVRSGVRIAYLYDMISESEPVLHGLIREVDNFLKARNVDVLVYQLSADKAHRRMLARSGFIPAPFVRGLLATVCLKNTSRLADTALSLAQKEWFVQLGDSDAVSGYKS